MAARPTPLRLWAPVAAWMAVISILSTRPVPAPASDVPDWASHSAAYAVLAVLVCRGLAGGLALPAAAGKAAAAAALAFAYGAAMELTQSFIPGRLAEASDLVKNLAGAAAGATLCALPRGRHGRNTA